MTVDAAARAGNRLPVDNRKAVDKAKNQLATAVLGVDELGVDELGVDELLLEVPESELLELVDPLSALAGSLAVEAPLRLSVR